MTGIKRQSALEVGQKLDAAVPIKGMQTETPAFCRWFGDSKVVDASREPLVVYHGSGSPNIRAFKPGVDGAGWFSEDPDLASVFAQEGGGGRGDTIYPAYLSFQNPLDVRTTDGARIMREANDAMPSGSTRKQLEALGYDGLIATESGGTTYLAFRPNQIKSATGNNGEFCTENPDITR